LSGKPGVTYHTSGARWHSCGTLRINLSHDLPHSLGQACRGVPSTVAATELEVQIDDEPCDTDELEMGWTGLTANAGNMPNQDWIDEAEADGSGGDANN
jgi:hypothetical protein